MKLLEYFMKNDPTSVSYISALIISVLINKATLFYWRTVFFLKEKLKK